MEEYFCNICERSIEVPAIENHITESDHVARKKMLEKQLQDSTNFPKSLKSSVGLWEKD
jgi:hypothetical protein